MLDLRLKKFGYQIFKEVPDQPTPNPYIFPAGHERILPTSSYAPWRDDAKFQRVYQAIKSNTMVDEYRCWELWTLARQTEHLPGAILEVGVWRGGTGVLLAAASLARWYTDQYTDHEGRTFLCDTFKGVVKGTGIDGPQYSKDGEHADATMQDAWSLVRRLGVAECTAIVKGIFPDEIDTAKMPQVYRLCHIDVDTHDSARDVFNWAWPRLSVGGVVVFDDYGFSPCPGVTKFVNDLKVGLKIHNLNGHAIVVKV